MTQRNLSERTGLSEKHLSHIINGEASITVETALLLENVLGGTASFWTNLERNYQETKARLDRASVLKREIGILAKFPYAEIQRRGYVEPTTARERKVENLWRFFGVNSLAFVETTEAIAYRRKGGREIRSEAIAAWLRCGEIESKKEQPAQFSAKKLNLSLEKLRHLTLRPAEEFSVKARDILLGCGVSLVYIAHFPGTGVSGAVRWIGDNPLVQLSLLGAYADIFWFNLFHEIGHLLLHGKKAKFIEFDNRNFSTVQQKEQEADAFASNCLIPSDAFLRFVKLGDFTGGSVMKFAQSIGIDPGIVEGRLCHDKVSAAISWSKPLGFRKRLRFAEGV